MKESILAQKIAQEFIARFAQLSAKFDPENLKFVVLGFLQLGPDDEDRAEAFRLSLAKANRHSTVDSILERAQEILDWPPKPKPVVEKKQPRPKARGKRKAR